MFNVPVGRFREFAEDIEPLDNTEECRHGVGFDEECADCDDELEDDE